MKFIIIALFCCIAISHANTYPRSKGISFYNNIIKIKNEVTKMEKMDERIVSIIDEDVDNAMENIQNWIIQNGLDPMEVPDMEKGFSVWVGLIEFHGEFSMTHGWLQGLSSVRRGGTALLEKEENILNFFVPFSTPTILVSYDYKSKIMDLGPRGSVEGKIHNLQILVDIRLDTDTRTFSLDGFRFLDAEKISVKFSGNILTDWLVNALTGVATTLFHDILLDIVQERVREVVEDALKQINENINASRIY